MKTKILKKKGGGESNPNHLKSVKFKFACSEDTGFADEFTHHHELNLTYM